MDIAGLNPTIISDQPVFPDNWKELSQKAKDCYNELDKEYYDENPGVYFRANIWSWRPIYYAILEANRSCDLGISPDTMDGMAYNSGHGLKEQEDCNKLADALDEMIEDMKNEGMTEYGFNLGLWNLRNGTMLSSEDIDILNDKYPEGSLITDMPVTLATGDKSVKVWPSHVTKLDHMQEFTLFLRNCGGFEIY